LSQHPVSVGDLIEQAVRTAVTEWLDAHGEEIYAAIAAHTGSR
jgi:hypothetical protein